jgi:peptidoglycan/xylan/chitin deacetylase (PgdA/CDA1 family)
MAASAVVLGPPPLWVPVAFAVVYLTLIGVGVMNLQLRMFGDAVCDVPEAEGRVALTFDDGPDPESTRHVLRILSEAHASATFFVVGKKVQKHPEVLREIVAAGHALGVHSYDHNRLYAFLTPNAVRDDIERTRDVIEEATGQRPVWFRPPVGQMSPRTAAGVERARAVVVGWNIRARDGLRSTKTEDCERRVKAQIESGSIVLLHDAWETKEVEPGESSLDESPAGVQALRSILAECKRRGLEPQTLDQLLAAPSGSSSAGSSSSQEPA